MRLIDADALVYTMLYGGRGCTPLILTPKTIAEAPTVKAELVVYCKDCVLHGVCTFEDIFIGACRLEKAFCCIGKRKENKDIPICLTEDCPYQKGNPCEAWESCGGFEDKENE